MVEKQFYTAVAPLAGSVDRNRREVLLKDKRFASLPSRGAWIEMPSTLMIDAVHRPSLPSRGAWIEIRCHQEAA